MIARTLDPRGYRPARVATALAILGGAALLIALGAAIARSRTTLALAPVAAALIWVFARRPLAAYLAVVVAVSSFAYAGAWPTLSFQATQISVAEAVLGLALIGRLAARSRPEAGKPGIEGVLVAVLLVAALIGVEIGNGRGVGVHGAFLAARAMVFYAAFWLARPLFLRPDSRSTALFGLAAVAMVVVALQVVQVILGSSYHLFLTGSTSSEVLTLQSEASGSFLRVRPPGITLVYVTCAFAAAYLFWGPPRRRLHAGALLLVALVGIALSLNRNMLLGLALGLSLTLLVAPRTTRAVAILASMVILVVGVGAAVRANGGAGNPVVDRVVSIGNWSQLDKTTLADRYYENHLALKQLRAHPITGIGWGTSYGATRSTADGVVTRSFIHNQYFGLWLRAGLLGVVAICAALLAGVRAGVKWSRTRPVDDAWLGAGVIASLVAIAMSSIAGIYMMDADAIVPLVTVLALAAALRAQLSTERVR